MHHCTSASRMSLTYTGDGGLHGQLLQNNGFQGNSPGLKAYAAIGGVTISQDTANPVSTAIKSSLKVAVTSATTGMVGFSNSGYEGVPVTAQTYATYFYVKGTYSGTLEVQLVGTSSGIVYASRSITVSSNSSSFTFVTITDLVAKASPDGNNQYQILFDASKAQDASLNFGLPQLYPITYHAR
jgi:alpha-L-arabinofuranosidase